MGGCNSWSFSPAVETDCYELRGFNWVDVILGVSFPSVETDGYESGSFNWLDVILGVSFPSVETDS